MSQISVGAMVRARFGSGIGVVRSSKVVAVQKNNVLVASQDGMLMGKVVLNDPTASMDVYDTTVMCQVGATGYTKERAAKTLGFRDVKFK